MDLIGTYLHRGGAWVVRVQNCRLQRDRMPILSIGATACTIRLHERLLHITGVPQAGAQGKELSHNP